ncbi:Satratoxin biosynthesis SC1 cluster protein 4 [Paramyrothecium foliicola]|nr:Satratoxin biosynthesis SC1 cluster protein 4 [Paramyrothecium foliicola]
MSWVMTGLMAGSIMARLLWKYYIQPIVIAFVGLLPTGLGRGIWTLTPDQIDKFGLWFYMLEPLYFFQIGMIKMPILFFYIRLFIHVGLERVL